MEVGGLLRLTAIKMMMNPIESVEMKQGPSPSSQMLDRGVMGAVGVDAVH